MSSAAPAVAQVPAPDAADQVVLRVPADPAYLTVLRTATAGLAARLDLTLDEIEDLRIAVDEACALLLAEAATSDELEAVFDMAPDSISVRVAGPARDLPPPDSVAWAVLAALVGEIDAGERKHDEPTGSWVRLSHRRAWREG